MTQDLFLSPIPKDFIRQWNMIQVAFCYLPVHSSWFIIDNLPQETRASFTSEYINRYEWAGFDHGHIM